MPPDTDELIRRDYTDYTDDTDDTGRFLRSQQLLMVMIDVAVQLFCVEIFNEFSTILIIIVVVLGD